LIKGFYWLLEEPIHCCN